MRRRVSLREQLRHVPLLETLSDLELTRVARLARRIREPAGELLVKEGEAGHEFLIVLEGEIDVRHGDQVVGTLGPGAYVGELALLEDLPRRTATVRARTPVTIAFIGRRDFERLLSDLPELARQIHETSDQRRRADADPPAEPH
jgi:CRP-like cAMP-binding protein